VNIPLRTAELGPTPHYFWGFYIIHRLTQPVGLLWTSDQLVAEAAICTTQSQETNFHALSGILTGDPSNQAASDLRLRKHGHQDWP